MGERGLFYCKSWLFSESKQHTLEPLWTGIVITNNPHFVPLRFAQSEQWGGGGEREWRWQPNRAQEPSLAPGDGNNRNRTAAPAALQIRATLNEGPRRSWASHQRCRECSAARDNSHKATTVTHQKTSLRSCSLILHRQCRVWRWWDRLVSLIDSNFLLQTAVMSWKNGNRSLRNAACFKPFFSHLSTSAKREHNRKSSWNDCTRRFPSVAVYDFQSELSVFLSECKYYENTSQFF